MKIKFWNYTKIRRNYTEDFKIKRKDDTDKKEGIFKEENIPTFNFKNCSF